MNIESNQCNAFAVALQLTREVVEPCFIELFLHHMNLNQRDEYKKTSYEYWIKPINPNYLEFHEYWIESMQCMEINAINKNVSEWKENSV